MGDETNETWEFDCWYIFDLEMTVPKLIGFLIILGAANGIVISLDVEKYLKELTDRSIEMNHIPNCLTMLSSHHYFLASYQIYFYGPQWNNYTYSCFVQFMVFRYKSRYGQHCLERTVIRIQGLHMDSKEKFYSSNKFMYAPVLSLIVTVLPPNL